MKPNDALQPREVSNGYFWQAEELKDFIDYLFDVEEIGDYEDLFNKFKKHEAEQFYLKENGRAGD